MGLDIGLGVQGEGLGGEGALYDLGMWDAVEGEQPVLSAGALTDFYAELIRDFPIVTIEDAFDEDDWPNWSSFVSRFGKEVQVVGDDLTVTNPTKISRAVEDKAANALLLKVNQIGSVTEAIQAVKDAKRRVGRHDSHRSGETEDTYIADLAVGRARPSKRGHPAAPSASRSTTSCCGSKRRANAACLSTCAQECNSQEGAANHH